MITEVLFNITFISDIVPHMVPISTFTKIMADVGDILNDDDFFGDVVDTTKEDIEQHKKREELKSVIDKGKAFIRA